MDSSAIWHSVVPLASLGLLAHDIPWSSLNDEKDSQGPGHEFLQIIRMHMTSLPLCGPVWTVIPELSDDPTIPEAGEIGAGVSQVRPESVERVFQTPQLHFSARVEFWLKNSSTLPPPPLDAAAVSATAHGAEESISPG